MIKDLERNFCVMLTICLSVSTLIICAGFTITSVDSDEDSIEVMGEVYDPSQTMMLDNVGERIYDPADKAEKQKELDRMARENGCIVVLSQESDTANEAVTQPVSNIRRNYYSLPLNDDQQDKIFTLCEQYDLPAELVFGIILADSERDGDHTGHTLTYPHPESAAWYISEYAIADPESFEGNMTLAVIMLSEYYHRYPDVHMIAICYESGEKQALELRNNGITETEYSASVALKINTLQLRER